MKKRKISRIGAVAMATVLTVQAVSYTHLDVYKRQLIWFCASVSDVS